MALDYTPAVVPAPGQVISVMLQMSTFGVLCVCFTRRASWITNWRTLPLAIWLILMIYIDSTLFVLATSIIVHGLGINSSRGVCEGGILLCLVCYMTTKILIYYFLVERAYIVRGSLKPRMQTKLWLFNCLFMMLPYTVFVIMNFIWRITYINEKGMCIIGMQKIAMLPLITFEVVVNIYLTLLFVLPLRRLYSYRHNANPKLKRMTFRSLVGSLATLTTSVVNLTVLMVLRGEPGWICLMCCNADILFCVVVLHWVTSKDKPSSYASSRSRGSRNNTIDAGRDRDYNRGSIVITAATATAAPSPEKRVSTAQQEVAQFGSDDGQGPHLWPYDSKLPSPPKTARLPGSVTTEIHSAAAAVRSKSRNGRVLQKSRDDGADEAGDEVELRKIHVQREVCIDSAESAEIERGFTRQGRSGSVEDAWRVQRSVSAEKMV